MVFDSKIGRDRKSIMGPFRCRPAHFGQVKTFRHEPFKFKMFKRSKPLTKQKSAENMLSKQMILFQIQSQEQSIPMFNIEVHVRFVYHSNSNKYYIR